MSNRLDYVWAHQLPKKGPAHSSNYPRISNVQITAAGLVTWTTDIASTSQVHFGLSPNLGPYSDYDATLVTSHSVQLTGLSAGNLYYVRVQSFYVDSLSISDLYTFTKTGSLDMSAYTVTNLTSTVLFDASDTSIDNFADVLGTLIEALKVAPSPFVLSGFVVVNVVTTTVYDVSDFSLDNIANTLGSLITSLQGATADTYVIANVTTLLSYDADNTSLDELANVLGSVIASLRGAGIIQ